MIVKRALVAATLTFALIVSLVATAVAQVQPATGSRPVEDHLYAVASVVPETWSDIGGGAYTRGTPPDDLALIVIQSAPATPDQMWAGLLPSLALTEVPEPSGELSSDEFEWTLYHVDISLPQIEVAVELGLAEQDGRTYLVMLQSAPDELETLREQVLLPALEATAPLAPEPTPHPSTFDYRIEEVTFPGAAEGVELAGTLTLPDGPGPHPVVVTMSGSGPSDRDESIAPISELKPFAILADALTSAGVGVLRYDDRGVGASTGDHAATTVEGFAADAAAAIDYLETRDDVDPQRIGLFGHSEGGIYAAMLGATDPRVAFIGTMAPPATDGVTILSEQTEAIQRAEGASEDDVATVVEYIDAIMPVVRAGDAEAIEEMVLDFYGRLWDDLTPEEQAVAGERDAFAASRGAREIGIYTTDWFRSFLDYDPAVDWAKVTVPVLAVFGGKDVQALPDSNAQAMRTALAAAGNEDVEIVVIPDANHLFQEAETGALSEYARLEGEFIDGFVDTVVDWMVVRAGVAQ